MTRFTAPIISALQKLGLSAEASGRNDILVDGRKVSGTAQRLYKDRILHHGTLLFDTDFSVLSDALRVDPDKYRSKGMVSVKSRVGNIRDMMLQDMELLQFWSYLRDSLTQKDMKTSQLSKKEMLEIQRLKEEKYDGWEWNFGHAPRCQLLNKIRWSGGLLEVHATIENGLIMDIEFFGDFLSADSLSPVQDALRGCYYRREDIVNVLKKFPLSIYFGTITEEELLTTILDS